MLWLFVTLNNEITSAFAGFNQNIRKNPNYMQIFTYKIS